MESKVSLHQMFLLNLLALNSFSGLIVLFGFFLTAARDTTDLEIFMPVITTELQLLEWHGVKFKS